MSTTNTNSTLDSKTRTGLSTQVLVYVNGEPVGAVQSLQITQNRPTKGIQEVGTDGLIEIVPSSATTYSVTCNRIVFDGLSLPESMARGYVNIAAQRIPFNIVIIDRFFGDTTKEETITTLHNCWFESLGKNYQAQDYVIQENATLKCEAISTFRNGQSVVLSQGQHGARSIEEPKRDRDGTGAEELVDTGNGSRGAMDFPGIIQAAY